MFNQALLAKQAWRLLIYPNSLCAKLLKAKYYPFGDMLDTSFPQIPHKSGRALSMAWISKKGVIWRVNNGHNIKI